MLDTRQMSLAVAVPAADQYVYDQLTSEADFLVSQAYSYIEAAYKDRLNNGGRSAKGLELQAINCFEVVHKCEMLAVKLKNNQFGDTGNE